MKIDRSLAIKIGIGAVVVIGILALIGFALSVVSTLLPVAVVAVLVYLAYRWYAGRQPVKQGETVVVKAEKVEKLEKPARATVKQQTAAPEAETDTDQETWDKEDFTAQVERLAEKERELQQKKDVVVNDALRAQLAERRKRLGLDD